jgi:hypothetical protein
MNVKWTVIKNLFPASGFRAMGGMTRRQFMLRGIELGVFSATVGSLPLMLPKPAEKKLTVALFGNFHESPAMASHMAAYLRRFSEQVSRNTEGELRIELVGAGQPADIFLKPTLSRLETLPSVALLAALSAGEDPLQKLQRLQSLDVENAWSHLYSNLGVKPLSFGAGSVDSGHASWRELQAPQDLQGLRSCALSLRPTWLSQAGIRFSKLKDPRDLVRLLSERTVDISPPLQHSVHQFLGTAALAPYYYESSWSRSLSPYELAIELPIWDRLGGEHQNALRKAAHSVGQEMLKSKLQDEARALVAIRGAGLAQVLRFPEQIEHRFLELSNQSRLQIAHRDSVSTEISRLLARPSVLV